VEDEQLAIGILEGDHEALQVLLSRFYPPIERYLFHACGCKDEAEDLTCQTLLRVRKDIRQLKDHSLLKPWIYKVAHRELLMWRRKRLLHLKLPHTPSPSPSHSIDEIIVHQALSRIPSNHREAFLLIEVEGLSIAEVAAALGIPQGTVKSRCHHARRQLRQLLATSYPVETKNAEPAIK